MFMIMEVNESFSFEAKTKADQLNPKVQEWETLMGTFQTIAAASQARRKMATDGTSVQVGRLGCSRAAPATRASDSAASIRAAPLDRVAPRIPPRSVVVCTGR